MKERNFSLLKKEGVITGKHVDSMEPTMVI